MKMFVALIILILTSFLAPIKVTCRRGGGGGGGGRSGGFSTFPSGGSKGSSHKVLPHPGGNIGGNNGHAHIPLPDVCTPNVVPCINTHIHGYSGPPKYGDYCCMQFKVSTLCLCRYQQSGVSRITAAANAVARSCNFVNTQCPASSGAGGGGGGGGGYVPTSPNTKLFPMPRECRQDVQDCVINYIYEDFRPKFRGPCCQKFKHSKLCVCKFQTSGIFVLSKGAYGVVKGCHFVSKTDCPRTY